MQWMFRRHKTYCFLFEQSLSILLHSVNAHTIIHVYLLVHHKAFKFANFNILDLVEIQLFALHNCLTQLTHEYLHCQQLIHVQNIVFTHSPKWLSFRGCHLIPYQG